MKFIKIFSRENYYIYLNNEYFGKYKIEKKANINKFKIFLLIFLAQNVYKT